MKERIECGGLTRREHLCFVEILGYQRPAARPCTITGRFGEAGIPLCYLVVGRDASEAHFMSLCISASDQLRGERILAEIGAELSPRRMQMVHPVVVLTVYGPHFLDRHGLAGEFVSALTMHGLTALSICSSVNSVAFVVREEDEEATVQALAERFRWPT